MVVITVATRIAPTRGNLVKLQRANKQAKNGRDLLEQKRQVLMMELVKHIDNAKTVQNDVAGIFASAYTALERANLSLGIDAVEDISAAIPIFDDITVRLHSVMGVEIPDVDPISEQIEPAFSLYSSNSALDDAYLYFRKVLVLLLRLAEVETSVFRLAVQIRKTHRRVNALDKVVMPANAAEIAFVNDVLEEGDREDFVRMKAAKKIRENKQQVDKH